MIIFTKYSNERRREFCIQTEIHMDEQGRKTVRKSASFPEAEAQILSISRKYEWLKEEFAGNLLRVNPCVCASESAKRMKLCAGNQGCYVEFPFREGQTLEEKLDGLLKQNRTGELLDEIRGYFALFSEGAQKFAQTEAFREVFGDAEFTREQTCRRVSDIDMIFANAIETEQGYELIDYEWTFDFPVPVRFLQYRCLYYYLLGNTKRDVLLQQNLYEQFDISKEEQRQFEQMERCFQAYILGDYIPAWKLYDDISDGVIPVQPLVQRVSAGQRAMRTVEAYFDDGRGFGTWSWKKYQVEPQGRISLRIELPQGTKQLRIDPCGAKSIVRLVSLEQNGSPLTVRSNGEQAPSGDYIFDTEDPQLIIEHLPQGTQAVEIVFFSEQMSGLGREVILNQNGRIRWMEQTKVWKLYRKLRGR